MDCSTNFCRSTILTLRVVYRFVQNYNMWNNVVKTASKNKTAGLTSMWPTKQKG